ncbi:MAG: DsbA family protein [Chloroflexi bacterium]|nr:DsbA family protein [Chloroflexota bacterium]
MIEDQIPNEAIFEERPKHNWTIWLAAGGCAVIICAAFFVGGLLFAGADFVKQFLPDIVQVAEEVPREITQSNTMGDPKAAVHIIEYGDFQCPYCLKFWSETEPQLIEEYVNTGRVYFEYRSYPILGPESFTAAEGAYCAGDQGKFWQFHDTLFTNWTGENVGDFTKDKLTRYAEALNLNAAEFESCLGGGKYKRRVEQDKAQGEADGVHATPTFIINGVKVEGAQSFDILKKYIEDALNGNLNTESG